MNEKKCIVMLSGGLDSRLAVKIMQEQGFEVLAVYFKLPFGCSFHKDVESFSKENNFDLKIFDCTKGELLQGYLSCIRSPKHGLGAGVNPCVDCKIFMFRKAREFANDKKIDLIVSGEVLGERPMSQLKKSMELIENNSDLSGRLLRPLSAKILPETNAERNGLVNREKLYDFQGRKRDKQIALANKFGINYPEPAGGCLLCEKALRNRFSVLLEKELSNEEVELVKIGRHFIIGRSWIVLGRDEKENKIIEDIGKKVGRLFICEDNTGPSAIIIGNGEVNKKVRELIRVYSKNGSLKERKKFDELRL